MIAILVLALLLDAPAPKPSPRPTPRPSARPVPVEVVPIDVPGEPQPDTLARDAAPEEVLLTLTTPAPPPVNKWAAAFDPTKWTLTLDTGISTVILNKGEKREYASAGIEVDGPMMGLDIWTRAELMGVQDGGRLQFTNPQSFRAVQVEARVGKTLSEAFAVAVRGGTTLSVEGGIAAPIDPRLWTLQGEASAKLKRVIVRGRGGHDGKLGGYGLGAEIEIPVVGGRPQLVARYDYPLTKINPNPSAPLPWQITGVARIIVVKSLFSDLF